MKIPTVYVPMCADILHPGHVQLLRKAGQYGEVVVGLLSDAAIEQKKGKRPILTYDERFLVVNSVRYVTKVIEQKTPSYEENLRSLRPEYVVHGNDWSDEAKKTVENTIAKWGGKLVETDYSSYPASSTVIKQRILNSLDK